ncbi:ankyrin-1-like [Xenia sp. Carnegie-2017]|uniref:ankyrin-1-like n=1 Tax=Xenia sp. Carnegie-2017 TaxID=2897299 RepID=UPI001F042331|nr:ankyrin-1-like [Xenia sp. Carnegie-2017]
MANTSRKWYNFVRKKDNIAETSDLVLKSPIPINEQCNTDVKLNGNKTGHSLANRLKIAAIYDDIQAIINILSVNNSNKEIQRLLSKRDERGRPCIFYALESRSLNSFSCLLNYIQETKCVIAENGETVLHVAAKIGDVYILRNLLEKDFVAELVNNVENINARSPLHFAAMHNNLNIAKEFLQHGGKITEDDMTEKSPLHIAAYEGHTKMLDLFLKHEKGRLKALLFSEEYGGSQYRNILHVAINSGNESLVEVCLQQDENIIRSCLSQEIKNNNHLIHDVCKYGMEKLLSRFVSMMGDLDLVLLNRKDERGHTPLHRAAINNHSSLVSYIGSLSKDFVNELTNYSQSALILATQLGHIEVVKELLKLKADFTIRDNSYKTVLHYAIAYPEILKILLKKNNVISSLINEITADDGYTPLHDAACKGFIESVEILIEHGADLNVFTKAHQSPLHCAVISQKPDVVKIILDHEPALTNKIDANKQTPLHTAAECGDQEIVTCLLHRGAILLRHAFNAFYFGKKFLKTSFFGMFFRQKIKP